MTAPTAFSALQTALYAALTASPALAGGRVYVNRLRVLDAAVTNAIVIRLESSVQADGVLGYSDWHTTIAVECYGRSPAGAGQGAVSAEQAVDDLLDSVVPRLHALDMSGQGAMGFVVQPQVEWQRDVDGSSEVCAIVRFLIRHRTQAGTLQPWA